MKGGALSKAISYANLVSSLLINRNETALLSRPITRANSSLVCDFTPSVCRIVAVPLDMLSRNECSLTIA